MNECSHNNAIFLYRGILACDKCGLVFGPEHLIKCFELNLKISTPPDLTKNKEELANSKIFLSAIKSQTS